MSSRDNKTKILYALNYFRSIQKRLALDLREFGTRERMETHLTNPMVHSAEANSQVVNAARSAVSMASKPKKQNKSGNLIEDISETKLHKRLTVFDEEAISKMRDMVSMRMYKNNGYFNNRVFNTCPAYPKFHDTYGEPVQHSPVCDTTD